MRPNENGGPQEPPLRSGTGRFQSSCTSQVSESACADPKEPSGVAETVAVIFACGFGSGFEAPEIDNAPARIRAAATTSQPAFFMFRFSFMTFLLVAHT
jgi:hypothetical protein